MKAALRLWPELAGFSLGLFALGWGVNWFIALLITLLWLLLVHGHVHVPDNVDTAVYFLGNYVSCIGPGHHFVLWPFFLVRERVSTALVQTSCKVSNASSRDRVPFTITLDYSYRFWPRTVGGRQYAHELIASGPSGQEATSWEAARGAALCVIRQFEHAQIMTGGLQNGIQDRVAQETDRRLIAAGIRIQTAAFRASFEGPSTLNSAYVQQQAALPSAQGTMVHMSQVLDVLRRYGPSELQQYLDLLMVRLMGNQNSDPLSALLAREWFRSSRANSAGSP